MNILKINIGQDEVVSHLLRPNTEEFSYAVSATEIPELRWCKVTSLGFGYEKDKSNPNADSEDKLTDYAASLFAACGQPFSLLCERKADSIACAIGTKDETLAASLLKGAFGTVKAEKYTPAFSAESGLYAHSFKAVRGSADEMDKRETAANIHMSKWVDAVARCLTQYPGMVRLDFMPADSSTGENNIKIAQEFCDKISAYIETSVQAGDNISYDTNENFVKEGVRGLVGHEKPSASSNGSVSWKNASAKLNELKKEGEYLIRLFSEAQKEGWTVQLSVSADLGFGKISSDVKNQREKALTVPLSEAIAKAGYTCRWSNYNEDTKKKADRAILLPSSYAAELVSFPTTSFYGYERVKNNYYNVNLPVKDKAIPFAPIMQYDEEQKAIILSIPEKDLNRHAFVAGMTGSGKTNTVHLLLSEIGDFPFLVIEPVKGEYHSLPGVKTYTMTAGSSKALCINPFWFPQGSSLQYHIDCLKQIISSAFNLSAAMPNILEQCLVRVYQHSGWDFIQNKNRFASELPENMLYPTFSDLCNEVDIYLETSGFGEQLKGDYRGALLSRLQSFTSGPKGTLLNTTEHLPCDELGKEKIVISLDALADDADKSIVMGVIIAQYYEYLKNKCKGSRKKELQHLVVIEEAHHLFAGDASSSSAPAQGESGESSSQELVKTLNNILAEIRAYGEGFIIVDQSPSALHPSVLKNTGVKIIHRMDYGKDIEAIQDVLLLDKDDKELAALEQGQALVRYDGMRTCAKVQVPLCETKEASEILECEEISGNSVVNTLLEDETLSKYVSSVILCRLINHLLYDDFENSKEMYRLLCAAVKTAMIKYGFYELAEEITQGSVLAEYISTLLPAYVAKLFPNQYSLSKKLVLFANRFLSLATEAKGELSKYELDAFESYRNCRLAPQILDFFAYSDNEHYIRARRTMGNGIDINLICNLASDLIKLKIEPTDFSSEFNNILLKSYFLCIPKDTVTLNTRTLGVYHLLPKEKRGSK